MSEETKNCCDVWPKFWPAFNWMSVEIEGEKMVVMPYHQNPNQSNKWRVNNCPSCGTDVRSTMLRQETLADALF